MDIYVELVFVQVITVELILHWIADKESSSEIEAGNYIFIKTVIVEDFRILVFDIVKW